MIRICGMTEVSLPIQSLAQSWGVAQRSGNSRHRAPPSHPPQREEAVGSRSFHEE